MRFPSALLACAFLLASAAAAFADSHVFIIENQADGYGVDQCLAKGEQCGAHAALSYCRSRDFAKTIVLRPEAKPRAIAGADAARIGSAHQQRRPDRAVDYPHVLYYKAAWTKPDRPPRLLCLPCLTSP